MKLLGTLTQKSATAVVGFVPLPNREVLLRSTMQPGSQQRDSILLKQEYGIFSRVSYSYYRIYL
ncbi:MAG: hypothetical protein ACI9HK_000886 [Pirellulaceae bacterium]|jgi:hypothetical protein